MTAEACARAGGGGTVGAWALAQGHTLAGRSPRWTGFWPCCGAGHSTVVLDPAAVYLCCHCVLAAVADPRKRKCWSTATNC